MRRAAEWNTLRSPGSLRVSHSAQEKEIRKRQGNGERWVNFRALKGSVSER
jgi:hypothetical protein